MSEIVEALKDEEQDFWISNEERVTLVEMLAFIAEALRTKKIWFNDTDREHNREFATFAENMARRFANMPVIKEN